MAYVIPSPEGFKLLALDKAVKAAYFRCTREVIGLKASVLMRFKGSALLRALTRPHPCYPLPARRSLARRRVIRGCLPMKKIGILFGQEHSFPPAFVERVNQKTGGKDIAAEFVRIDSVIQSEPCGYDVVIDRISQDVPFYRAWLKNAALTGTAVVNNPFWWSADEKFFNNALATRIGVAVPRTVLLPSNQPPPDTNDKSFRNLGYPLDW